MFQERLKQYKANNRFELAFQKNLLLVSTVTDEILENASENKTKKYDAVLDECFSILRALEVLGSEVNVRNILLGRAGELVKIMKFFSSRPKLKFGYLVCMCMEKKHNDFLAVFLDYYGDVSRNNNWLIGESISIGNDAAVKCLMFKKVKTNIKVKVNSVEVEMTLFEYAKGCQDDTICDLSENTMNALSVYVERENLNSLAISKVRRDNRNNHSAL